MTDAQPDPMAPADEALLAVIEQYHRRIDRGEPVDREAFVAEHPEHGEGLRSYFEDVNVVEGLAGPTIDKATEGTMITGETLNEAFTQTLVESSQSEPANVRVAADAPRTKFGRYRLLKELGRGAMGAVYLAHDEQLDREIALKIPQFGQDLDPALLERFYREARAAAALRHPGICPVFDVGEIDGQHYITMAFIKGRPLRDFTKTTRTQGIRQVVRVIRKLAMAMAEAHKHNVTHRDLKPANVMIDERKEPVVMDFGLARRSAEGEEKLTHSGTVIGTPAYMSPEQVDGDNDRVGPPADIYSLGVIFYEMLTGQLPFQGNLMSILKQIANDEPQPPSELRSEVTSELEAVCLKMMAKQIEDRYQSMEQVAADLTDFLKQKNAGTEESGVLETSKPPAVHPKVVPLVEATEPATVPAAPQPAPVETSLPSITPDLSTTTARTPRESSGGIDKSKLLIAGGLGGASLLLAGIVFIVQLGKVTVRITVDDPSLALKVDGDEVVIEGEGAPIRLSAGTHELIVKRDGLEFSPKEFKVTKDGKNAIHVVVVNDEVQLLTDGTRPSNRDGVGMDVASGLPPAEGPVDLKRGLIGHWNFEEGEGYRFADSSGNGNDGTLSEEYSSSWRWNRDAPPVSLAGRGSITVSDRANRVRIPSFDPKGATGQFTVAGWVRSESESPTTGARRVLFDHVGVRRLTVTLAGRVRLDTPDSKESSGAFSLEPTDDFAIPPQTWYHLLARYNGREVTVYLDGKQVAQGLYSRPALLTQTWCVIGAPLGKDASPPPFSIDDVRLYNRALSESEIAVLAGKASLSERVTQRSDSDDRSWRPVFDGKSLDGWELFGGESGDWKVVDGVLTSGGKRNRLVFTKETFSDFDVVIECRLDKRVNSGLFVRTNKSESPGVGYEAQLAFAETPANAGCYVGGIFKHAPFRQSLVRPNEWFTLEVRCRGPRITLFVNGEQTVEYEEPARRFETGHIALNTWDGGVAEFRRIEVRTGANGSPEAAPKAIDVKRGLVGHWNFEKNDEKTFWDESGGQNHAKLPGNSSASLRMKDAPPVALAGEGCLTLTDKPDHLTTPIWPGLDLKEGLTLAGWARCRDPEVNLFYARNVIEKSTDNEFRLAVSGYFTFRTGPDAAHVSLRLKSESDIPRDRWYHLTATWDRSVMRVYLDGELKNTRPYSGDILLSHKEVRLGRQGGTVKPAPYSIDDVRLYTRALSEAEIAVLAGKAVDPGNSASESSVASARRTPLADGPPEEVLRFERHERVVLSVDFHPHGDRIVSSGGDGSVLIWPLRGPSQPTVVQAPRQGRFQVTSVRFSPDGNALACGEMNGSVRLWDLSNGTPRLRLEEKPHTGVVMLEFSPDGRSLASGGRADGSLFLWDLTSDAPTKRVVRAASNYGVHTLAFSPDSSELYETVGIRQLPQGEKNEPAPDAGQLRKWDISKSTPELTGTTPKSTRGLWSHISVSHDGQHLAIGDDATVRVLKRADLSEIQSLNGHENRVIGSAFSPAGDLVFTSSYDRTIRVWDISSGKQVHEILLNDESSPEEIAISPDGRFLAGGLHDDTVRVWRLPARGVIPGQTSTSQPPPAVAPFDADQAKAHQQAWADELNEPVEIANSIGMKLVVIPPGSFRMGEDAIPVTLTEPFRFGMHEVTLGQWKAVMGTEPKQMHYSGLKDDNVPVTYVTWPLVTEFCRKLTARDRAAGKLADGWEYRLPTEAEWEFACRAGTTTIFSFGDNLDNLGDYAWFDANARRSAEQKKELGEIDRAVGQKKPNPWGLYDIHGNVWEWCADWYSEELKGGTDPTGPETGTQRVNRGGSYYGPGTNCQSTSRQGALERHGSSAEGFRVALCPVKRPSASVSGQTGLSLGLIGHWNIEETSVHLDDALAPDGHAMTGHNRYRRADQRMRLRRSFSATVAFQ